MMVRRPALEGSVRQKRTLPSWTCIPLAILALGALLAVIRFLSSEPAQVWQAAPSPQLIAPAQQKLSNAVEKVTPQHSVKPEIPEEMFVNAYVTANFHDRDLDGYTAAEIAELADVEFRVRFRTCGPTIVCDLETLSANTRSMRAMRLIEATGRSAQVQ